MVNLGGIDEPGHTFKAIWTIQTSQHIFGRHVFPTTLSLEIGHCGGAY